MPDAYIVDALRTPVGRYAGALSTILGAAIMNAVMVEVIQMLLDQGLTPPVLISANVDGSDEHNVEIMGRYSDMQWAPKFFF